YGAAAGGAGPPGERDPEPDHERHQDGVEHVPGHPSQSSGAHTSGSGFANVTRIRLPLQPELGWCGKLIVARGRRRPASRNIAATVTPRRTAHPTTTQVTAAAPGLCARAGRGRRSTRTLSGEGGG